MNAIEQAPKAAKSSRLWYWVGAAFALQLAAWTAWLIVASHHQIEEIPLATHDRRTSTK